MHNRLLFAVAVFLVALSAACSSGSSSQPSPRKGGGFRTLDAVVVERDTETGPSGAIAYYLGFEAKDGEATAHMRYPVTRDQYIRFTEGSHVKLVLADDELREIRRDTGN